MKLIRLSLLLAVAGLSACTTQMIKDTSDSIDQQTKESLKDVNRVGVRPAVRPEVVVSSGNGIWIPVSVATSQDDVDPRLKLEFSINRKIRSLDEAAERIVSLSKIPVYVSPDTKKTSDAGSMSNAPPVLTGGTSEIVIPALPADVVSEFDASYTGTLAGFLNVLSAHYGVSWDYRNGVIEFFKMKTKVYIIKAVPGDITSKSEVSPSSGEKTLSTEVLVEGLSIWDEIQDSIDTMLTEDGQAVVSPAIGAVTVTDTPRVLAMVEAFIEQQNKHLSRQVAVEVKVYSITLNDEDSYGINWNVVNEDLKSALGVTWSSGNPLTIGRAALTLKKFATGEALTDGSIAATNSKWQGSSAFIEALSTQGDVSVVTSATAVTLNNQPVPIHVGKTTSYLATSSTTPSTTAGIAPTVTLEPGSVTTGFTMNVLPHIQNKDELILQYALDLSSLTGLFTISSSGASIQVPEVETRRMLQRVSLKSGESIVLAGFENSEKKFNSRGVGKSGNTWFGGGASGEDGKTVIVVVVTPTIFGSE